MPDSWKLDLLLGKITTMEIKIEELKLYLREVVGENIRLRKLVETTDAENTFQENTKLLEDIRRIAEGKRIHHYETET